MIPINWNLGVRCGHHRLKTNDDKSVILLKSSERCCLLKFANKKYYKGVNLFINYK